jgi:hypothetical protein
MEMFSACCGPCVLCKSFGGCVAGHGDDHYQRAPESMLRRRMEKLRLELLKAYQIVAGEVVEAPLPADADTLRRNIARIEEAID